MADENNYMLISLDDEKSKAIAEVIGSKTCKKIISYLTENKEASQKDLSTALKIPINTVEYNIKKLLESGFIEKTKNFFWSKKGKKIIMYKLSKKSIIISHKKSVSDKIKSILPAFILTIAGTFAIWVYEKITISTNLRADEDMTYAVAQAGEKAWESIPPESFLPSVQTNPFWLWFFAGAILAILIISIINWRKL